MSPSAEMMWDKPLYWSIKSSFRFIAAKRGFFSVFLRDCRNCRVLVACGQLRTRDCQQLVLLLHCATQPIIEASTDVTFACFQLQYPALYEHMCAAGLCVFNSTWSCVHDFTPATAATATAAASDSIASAVAGAPSGGTIVNYSQRQQQQRQLDCNWSTMEQRSQVQTALQQIGHVFGDKISEYSVELRCDTGPVPFTVDRLRLDSVSICSRPSLLALFRDSASEHSCVMQFHSLVLAGQPESELSFCRSLPLSGEQWAELGSGDQSARVPRSAPPSLCVGLVYTTTVCLPSLCRQVKNTLCQNRSVPMHTVTITSDAKHLATFVRFCHATITH